tara:strand:- start:734 stop:985 length:252 start_codon:yes stop_codon:yes gene_type:complete
MINALLIPLYISNTYFCGIKQNDMSGWFSKKSRLEKLQKKYVALMRKSYRVALDDAKESDRVQEKAQEIYDEIRHLTLLRADK